MDVIPWNYFWREAEVVRTPLFVGIVIKSAEEMRIIKYLRGASLDKGLRDSVGQLHTYHCTSHGFCMHRDYSINKTSNNHVSLIRVRRIFSRGRPHFLFKSKLLLRSPLHTLQLPPDETQVQISIQLGNVVLDYLRIYEYRFNLSAGVEKPSNKFDHKIILFLRFQNIYVIIY